MRRGHDGMPQALGTATTSRGGLGDRGAVAVEFAVLFPVVLLMLVGIFDVGVARIEKMELTYVVQGAAQLEAAGSAAGSPGTGLAWATSQLAPPVSFTANPSPPPCPPGTQSAQITGQWPVSMVGVLPTLTLSASAQACWPITPAPPTTPPIPTP
jgi:hypothetical protein